MAPLEGDQPGTVGHQGHAFGIGLDLVLQQAAVEAAQLADPAVAQPGQIALGVVVDGRGEPGPFVGDRGERPAVGRDMEVRPAAETGRIGLHREAAAPGQAADPGGGRVVELEGQRGAADVERLLLRARRRQGCAGAGGGQQAEGDERADGREQAQAARRPDLPAAALAPPRPRRAVASFFASSSSNSEASCSIIVPPSWSASTMVTARR